MRTERVYLKPGELFYGEKPAIVTTVLGSCVAVTMFAERLKLGSICHAMLPRNPFFDAKDTFRYVDKSILHMIGQFTTAGVRREEIEVKLMGGADVLERVDGGPASVGQKNIKEAMDIIQKEGMNLSACDVGGEMGRKIIFFAYTGKVLLKRIAKRPPEEKTLSSRAGKYLLGAEIAMSCGGPGRGGWR